MGKTTLCNEICIKWARDGFLAKEFDVVILIPLRLAQQQSLKKLVIKLSGKENYQYLKMSGGSKCLIILEGLDEIAAVHQQKDLFFVDLIECNILEKATILITSRPHACNKLTVDRTIEIIGFGDKEIAIFVENSLPGDNQPKKIVQHLKEHYPHIYSLCYNPLSLVMIVDIFCFYHNTLPSTLTKLYQQFIVMMLQRQVYKNNKNKIVILDVPTDTVNEIETTLCKLLEGIPKEAVKTVYLLSKLAYEGLFDCFDNGKDYQGGWEDSKIIFTIKDLDQHGLKMSDDFDGYGLLEVTHIHELPKDTCTYNFVHLSIQECFCACYLATLPEQTQLSLFQKHWKDYPNVFQLYCGLTRLSSNGVFSFVYSILVFGFDYGEIVNYCSDYATTDNNIIRAMMCVYEGQHGPPCLTVPFHLRIKFSVLSIYDILCMSYVLLNYPVIELDLLGCFIDIDEIAKHYKGNKLLQVLKFDLCDLTANKMKHLMEIITSTK